MEVTNPNVALLSNFEVLSLMKELKQDAKSQKKLNKNQNLATICYETIKFLEQTPCKHYSKEIITQFLKAMEPFKLTKAEKLQILNLRPTKPVEIQLIVEESEERLTEEAVDNLLEVISQVLPCDEVEQMQE